MLSFKLYSLLESFLKVDPQFEKIIYQLREMDVVANHLYDILETDVKTNLNYLKPANTNQDIFFVNDTQVQRILDQGIDPFDKAVNPAKIGRSVQQILKANGIDVTPTDIEKFVNNYKNMYDHVILGKYSGDIEIVSGKMIAFWYDGDNYVKGGGSLNKSCMRGDECQDYFEIYVDNPQVCQMIILKEKNNLAGRALIWKLNNGRFYLDRTYTRYDHQVDTIYNYFKSLYPNGLSYQENDSNISVSLKYWDYKLYPYMDSLNFLDYQKGLLTDMRSEVDGIYLKLRGTDGDPTVYGGYWSERLDKYISIDIAVDIGGNDYVTKDMCQWSEYEDCYVYDEYVIDSERWGILNKNNCVQIEDDGEMIWVPNDLIIEVYMDGELKKMIQDDFNNRGYIRAKYRTSYYGTPKLVYAKEEDCITYLGESRYFVRNEYINSLIKDEKLVKMDRIGKNITYLLSENKYLPVVSDGNDSCYIPSKFNDNNYPSIETEVDYYMEYDFLYQSIFVRREIYIPKVLKYYPEKYHSEFMRIHRYLINEYDVYSSFSEKEGY